MLPTLENVFKSLFEEPPDYNFGLKPCQTIRSIDCKNKYTFYNKVVKIKHNKNYIIFKKLKQGSNSKV